MTSRYAIYYAPDPASPLARFGATWLGRDAETGVSLARPAVEGFAPEQLDRITAAPRGYGFHATLAPPLSLAQGYTRQMLDEAISAFAASRRSFCAPSLRLAAINEFLALVLADTSEAMQELAHDVAKTFYRFRAPPTAAEVERRRREGNLTPRQEALLREWGYPYIMDEFRFHMTLTGALDRSERHSLRRALEPLAAPRLRRAARSNRYRIIRAGG